VVDPQSERCPVCSQLNDLYSCMANTCSPTVTDVPELPIPELVENQPRSVAMLPSGAPALHRDEALELLEQLKATLHELRRLRAQVEAR
jgi:hypothetical protein